MTAVPTAAAVTAATLVAAVAVLAGCSGDAPAPVASVEPGPLDQMAELLAYGDEDETELRIQEHVAACMAEAGFEYVPVRTGLDLELAEPEEEPGTLAFAERWGYGASTDPYGQVAALAQATAPRDPNEAIVAAMGEAELEQYTLALWGPQDQDEPVEPERQGCQGWARHEVEVAESALGTARETYLRGARESWESAYADPRVAEAAARWSSCMADAGYPDLATPQAAAEAAYARWNAATDDAARAEAREVEIAMAVADVGCQTDARYPTVLADAVAEYQREFYAANRTELDALWEAARELEVARGPGAGNG